MDSNTLLIVAVVWLGSGILAALVRRGRGDAAGWFGVGLLLGPFALLFALLPGPVDEPAGPVCVNCGKVVARGRKRLCDHCGMPFAAAPDR